MKELYSPKEFAEMIGKSVVTLQRWDKRNILKSYRTPSGRRYYTHDQYVAYRKQEHPEERQDA